MSTEAKKQVQMIGVDIILVLHALSSVVKLYDSNNNAVVKQVDALCDVLQRGFALGHKELRLTLRSDEFFINGELLKVDVQLYLRAKELSEILEKLEWNDIRFDSVVQKSDIENFIVDFSKCVRKEKSTLNISGYNGIIGSKSKGSSAAAFRFEPNKLAIWLVAGLLDIVDNLYTMYEKGETPSLLPLRRSLQMIIDNMREYSGIYQMLSAFRDTVQPRRKAQARVAMCIDVIGFSAYLGRDNVEIMELSLSVILAGLSNTTNPIDSIQPILSFTGLGESSMGVVMLVHDSQASKQGKSVQFAGEVLMIVEEYHTFLDAHTDKPLPRVIFDMIESFQQNKVKLNIMQLFARYKGPFPIGSLILVDGQTMLVIGQSNKNNGKQRPIVAKLHNKQILDIMDLSVQPNKQIQEIQSVQQYNFVLEDLVM